MTEPRKLRLVKPRARIKGGITCGKCGHERFKFMKSCPRCDDTALRGLDTSTNELTLKSWPLWGALSLFTVAKLLGGAA